MQPQQANNGEKKEQEKGQGLSGIIILMSFITIVIAVYLIVAMYFTTTSGLLRRLYCVTVEINIWPVAWTFPFAPELLSDHPVSA